jgi:hypothetical protein
LFFIWLFGTALPQEPQEAAMPKGTPNMQFSFAVLFFETK